ncbi:MAG: HlyC/CorC family transporter [Deltaproteobacteria bacterium]|nr:HlyC/CorC family transporter [Deltaproteobacteria bacterium]
MFFLLLLASAFFSGAETAIFSLSRLQIHRLRSSPKRAAQEVVRCLREPRQILVTILLGNELANVSISIVGALIVSHYYQGSVERTTFVAVAVVTPIVLIFGEIVPKNIALRLAHDLAPVVVIPLRFFRIVVSPFRIVLSAVADGVIRLFGGHPETVQPMIVEQEFRQLVDLGKAEGIIVEEERELIHNVFGFTEKVVAEIMTPAEYLFVLPVGISYEELLTQLRTSAFSRIPLYEGTRDHIIGILHVRDLFAFDRQRAVGGRESIRSILHAPLFVDYRERIESLLKKFQENQLHMALVRKAEVIVGVVTMDDVLKELFGERSEG